jgi:hypothetical protein
LENEIFSVETDDDLLLLLLSPFPLLPDQTPKGVLAYHVTTRTHQPSGNRTSFGFTLASSSLALDRSSSPFDSQYYGDTEATKYTQKYILLIWAPVPLMFERRLIAASCVSLVSPPTSAPESRPSKPKCRTERSSCWLSRRTRRPSCSISGVGVG